jgi:hypothetical protein
LPSDITARGEMKRLSIVIVALVSVMTGCAFWKVTTLNPKRFAFIKNGTGPGEVSIKIDEYGLEELSVGIGVFNGLVCSADNELRRFQVMKPDGDLELIIGSLKQIKTKDTKAQNFNFGISGLFTMDEDGSVYIQNKFSHIRPTRPQDKDFVRDNIDFSPSYILVFNNRGELQYTLGQKGTPDVPFYQIERLSVDARGRLYIVSKTIDSWSIYRYKGKVRDYFINLSAMDFRENDSEEKKAYDAKIDKVKIFTNGETALVSVSYYQGLRLKYIKIFEYSLAKKKAERVVLEIPDPQNVLFDIVDDKFIYLWNISKNDVKFEVANLYGTIVNNVSMKFKNKRNYYTKIFFDQSGKMYSFHILRNGVEVVRWE